MAGAAGSVTPVTSRRREDDHEAVQRTCDVVIATRNRPGPLQRCLHSLGAQTAADFGIIVVDDHSDESLEVAVREVRESNGFAVPLHLVRLPERSGPASARNAGVDASAAEFIIFIDDDVVADRHLVEVHLSEVRTDRDAGSPIVSHGPFVEPPDWDPPAWSLWEAKMATRGTNAIVRGDYEPTWRNFHTGNNCLPREVFNAVGGFDETFLRAEDDEFGIRLHEYGCRFRFVPSALAWHYPNRSRAAWLEVPRAYAHYTVVIDQMYPHLEYLSHRHRELQASHALLRLLRGLAGGERRTAIAVRVAMRLAEISHRMRLNGVTLGALSVAYDLNYVDALRLAERGTAHRRSVGAANPP